MTRKREALTQAELKEHLHYDPETGIFTRLKSIAHRVKIGDIAGCLHVGSGYVNIRVFGIHYKAHRLAWLYIHGINPCNDIDHINGNRSDNRIINLRDVTRSVNKQNTRKCSSNNKSGFLGVRSTNGKFVALITIGTYDTPEEAHQAYLNVKRIIHTGCTI
jgi:HNH endonuclease